MQVTLQELAVARVNRILEDDTNSYERLADLLADIIHYARANELDFDEELDTAEMYVTEEESMDAELVS